MTIHENNMTELKPYQVGENDIVVAQNPEQALDLLAEQSAWTKEEMSDFEVEDLSNRLTMKLFDEEGKEDGTLGDWVSKVSEPQYLFGWE